MSKFRRAAKVDASQSGIVAGLRTLGYSVALNHDDILVGAHGKTYWFELKNPDSIGKDGKIRESAKKETQKKLERTWKGHYSIVTSVDEILEELSRKKC